MHKVFMELLEKITGTVYWERRGNVPALTLLLRVV